MILGRNNILKIGLAILFIIGFLFLIAYLKNNSPNQNDAKLNEIRVLIRDVPIFEGFTKVDENYSSRHMDAGIYQYFRSNADSDRVKNYYISVMPQKGWQLDSSKTQLSFRKNDVELFIEVRKDKNADWNYGFSYVWKASPN